MKRIMLDTNIYGKIIEKGEVELVESLMGKVKDIFVYGSGVVRKELRDDVVVSEDNKSMVSQHALKAYSAIGKLKKKHAPNFMGYETFKELLRGSSDGNSPKLRALHVPLVLLPNLLFVHKNRFNNHKPKHIFKPLSAFKSGLLSFLLSAIFFAVPVSATHNPSVSHSAVAGGTFTNTYSDLEVRL